MFRSHLSFRSFYADQLKLIVQHVEGTYLENFSSLSQLCFSFQRERGRAEVTARDGAIALSRRRNEKHVCVRHVKISHITKVRNGERGVIYL